MSNKSSLIKSTNLNACHSIDFNLCQSVLHNAKISPDSVAINDGANLISYKYFIKKAFEVSMAINKHNLSAGQHVALISNRNAEGLAAALGIMMSGCVYVPIPADYPTTRINFILKDSGASILILNRKIAQNICRTDIPKIFLSDSFDFDLDFSFSKSLVNIENCLVKSCDIAYILYTSGSTGQPKGVMVSHKAITNTFSWMIKAFHLNQGSCIPQKTSWGFTDSIWEMFLPLIIGGTVHIIDETTVRNPVALYNELKMSDATITQFVPPAVSTFLDGIEHAISRPSLPKLRWILNGGEELPRSLVDRWFSVFPDVGYANSYGMTESAIYATCYFMRKPPVWGMRRIPVGTPISNTDIYVLGDRQEFMEVDLIGEICIGGIGLMSGYWRQPELTKEVLIRNKETGSLIYRTGDYGYIRQDGLVAYLGRRDRQVQIRGMRVELGEVESAMMQHPSVKQGAVITQGKGDSIRLIGFFTTNVDLLTEEEVLSHLKGMLPGYMIPVRCILLERMPVTSHNKTDYGALGNFQFPKHCSKELMKAEPGSIEEIIFRVWEEVLEISDFGIDDGFFKVGGNSILIVRVFSNLPEEIKRHLEIPDLLQFSTIKELATEVKRRSSNKSTVSISKLGRNPGRLRAVRKKS